MIFNYVFSFSLQKNIVKIDWNKPTKKHRSLKY